MIVVVMGVTGCGKSTVGEKLAQACGWAFHDADLSHPAGNLARMRSGIALTDADRWPWFDRLNALLQENERRQKSLVLACSALKRAYRERLVRGCARVHFVLLNGEKSLIRDRLLARRGHFMNPALLDSQFEILEPPCDGLVLDVRPDPDTLVGEIRRYLGS